MSLVRALVVIAVFSVGVFLSACGGGGGSSSGAKEYKVTATEFKYNPGDQTFKAGSKVKVTMSNQGGVDHTWVLSDSDGKELFKLEVKVGKTGSAEFTAPAAGTYNIICDVAGHKEAGMTAKATITP